MLLLINKENKITKIILVGLFLCCIFVLIIFNKKLFKMIFNIILYCVFTCLINSILRFIFKVNYILKVNPNKLKCDVIKTCIKLDTDSYYKYCVKKYITQYNSINMPNDRLYEITNLEYFYSILSFLFKIFIFIPISIHSLNYVLLKKYDIPDDISYSENCGVIFLEKYKSLENYCNIIDEADKEKEKEKLNKLSNNLTALNTLNGF